MSSSSSGVTVRLENTVSAMSSTTRGGPNSPEQSMPPVLPPLPELDPPFDVPPLVVPPPDTPPDPVPPEVPLVAPPPAVPPPDTPPPGAAPPDVPPLALEPPFEGEPPSLPESSPLPHATVHVVTRTATLETSQRTSAHVSTTDRPDSRAL